MRKNEYFGQAFFPPTKCDKGGLCRTSFQFEGELGHAFHQLDVSPFFEMIGQMEHVFDMPQYFEWAMTFDHQQQPIYWNTQIADVDKRLDVMDFGKLGTIMFQGHT